MKAWILHDIGDIRYETTAEPKPGSGEVLVSVQAAGICGSDIPRIYQTGAYHFPLIPGHEFSGTVVKAGPGVDTQWLGKRVGVFPLIPCGTCGPCRKKQYELCRRYSYLGSRRDGGFAEYVAVPSQNLIHLPDSVSFEEGAMLEPMAVAVHAIRRVSLDKSNSAAICGLGAVGLFAAIFLREAGIQNLFLIGNKDSQQKSAADLMCSEEYFCNINRQNPREWLMERTNGCGADLIFECVGKPETLAMAVELAAPMGHICLVGNPHTDMALKKDIYWKILRNQLTVTGTWNSSFSHDACDDWHYVLNKLAQKTITPLRAVSHRLPLENLDDGFYIMRTKAEDYLRILAVSPGK